MRLAIPVFAFVALLFGSAQADAKSCSSFVVIKSYDAANKTVVVEHGDGSLKKYFPKPEGSPTDSTRIPGSCRGKVTKADGYAVTPTGGRMTVTQIRSNFQGKMLNNTSDPNWVPAKLKELIDSKATVVIVLRPGKKRSDPIELTTLYLPITDEELAEIKRIEAQAEDV